MTAMLDRMLRTVLTAAYAPLKRRARRQPGAHSVALTPDGRIVLVKLRYAPGWRLPGGGIGQDESARDAAMRELREEIGMTAHGAAEQIQVGSDPIIIVRNVRYRPRRWSWEIEEVMETTIDALPPDLSPIAARWLAAVGDSI